MSKTGMLVCALVLTGSAAAAGCASSPLKTEPSTSGIRAAEAVGATEVPRASLHLQLAKEELQRAKALAANGEDEQAASMLTRAEADAELALALSRADAERTEAQAAMADVRQLRERNDK